MAASNLCEPFLQELRKHNLIRRGQADQVAQQVTRFLQEQPQAEPAALAEFLTTKGVLTAFQSEYLLQGKAVQLVFGNYVLTERIGSGVLGTTHRAFSRLDDHLYTVEVLPQRAKWNIYLAYRQKKAFGEIRHSTVVPFVDVGTASNHLYLVWPRIEGERLDEMVQRKGKIPAPQATEMVILAAEGLQACHQQGIFHGLLKPASILRTGDGKIRVVDFGIGSLLAEKEGESLLNTMSTSNALTSALDCASPESLLDPSDRTPLGDQYSLGCILYFLLTGRYPFAEENTMKKLMAVQYDQPTPIREVNPAVPQKLAEILDKLLQKQPKDRFPTMTEVAKVLRAAMGIAEPAPGAGSGVVKGGLSGVTKLPAQAPGSGSGVVKGVQSGVQRAPAGSGGQRAAGQMGSGVIKAGSSGIQRGPQGSTASGVNKAPNPLGRSTPPGAAAPAPASKAGLLLIVVGILLGIGGTVVIAWLFMPR